MDNSLCRQLPRLAWALARLKRGSPDGYSLRANKLRWNDSNKQGAATVARERAQMVKTPDNRVYAVYDAPEKAFGSGMDGKGNIWLCLKERGENITRPELLVNPNEL